MTKALVFLSYLFPSIALVVGLVILIQAWQQLQGLVGGLECFCPSCEQTAVVEAGVATLGLIKVDIQGAVKQPGVYELRLGQRLADLVLAAGGFSTAADQEQVIKHLNLAKELKNQDKIYIPFMIEQEQAAGGSASSDTGTAGGLSAAGGASGTASSLISVNQASQKELQSLSGIGEVKSQAIIDNRPYANLEELVEKKILSENLFTSLRELITL